MNSDRELVKHVLVDIDELAGLEEDRRADLESALSDAIGAQRAAPDIAKRGISNKFQSQAIFFSDVIRALEAAGFPATRWSQRSDGGPESLLYRVAREIAEVAGIDLPTDLKRVSRQGLAITKNSKG